MKRNFEMAMRSLKSNRLRTALTVAIIAVGIMSIVGVQTALAIMTEKVAGSFSKLGATMYSVSSRQGFERISVREAESLKERNDFARSLCISCTLSSMSQIKSSAAVTDPVVSIRAVDENYTNVHTALLASGRNFSRQEVASQAMVAMIGDNVRKKLFGDGTGIGETIVCASSHYVVVGALERQGAMFGTGIDNSVLVPLSQDGDCCIDFIPCSLMSLADAELRARQTMRSIRRLRPQSEDDFSVVKADSAQDRLSSIESMLSLSSFAIGLITLLGSAVGLMNIMIVSVKERVREIGVRKALGARPKAIERQFLAESVLIGQIGGAFGVLLGLFFGNMVALLMEGSFMLPWKWVVVSFVLCLAVSLISGFMPARKAAALDPVEALRDK